VLWLKRLKEVTSGQKLKKGCALLLKEHCSQKQPKAQAATNKFADQNNHQWWCGSVVVVVVAGINKRHFA